MAVQTQIQTRRGTAASWTSTNPTLAAGEIGFETDTGKFKIGDGTTAWAALAYNTNGASASPLTTKGDLYTYGTGNTRLPVGANGETLVADSSTSTGLRYTAGTVQSNPVINSSFQNWQRGTSISLAASSPAYTSDRWYVVNGANQATTVSRQVTNDTTNLPFIQYCARVQRNSGQTGTASTITISQPFETVNSVVFAGKTVTFSYYARKGADFSSATSAITVYLATGTGTDQNQQGAGYTGQALPVSTSSTLTTTWQRFTHTATLTTNITEMQPIFTYAPTGTAGAADYFEVTGVQIDIGSVALPFRTYAGTIQGELAACQRYYAALGAVSVGIFESANSYDGLWALPVPMRTTPSISLSGTITGYGVASGNNNVTSVTLKSGNVVNQIVVNCPGPTGGAGTGTYTYGTGAILASAEL